MKFLADLHIHSKYSMATAKNLDIENLYINAVKKGISLVGTGDFTHPAWLEELKEKLEPDGDTGVFRLKKDIEKNLYGEIPENSDKYVRFILQCEISSIYKKDGRVRKNHNLVYFPDLKSVETFNAKLDKIGNIKSDGRPILGLDSKSLLEIALETDERAFFVPAHIWTPWFSLFGSKSGFDSIEECYEDLTKYIYALETGLSSDPEMNWHVSSLDRFTLISNSDAHSPSKLGREVNIFDCDISYYSVLDALKNKNSGGFKGTFEFYPEEGKYHYDGHRKCNVSLHPEDTLKMNEICPVCGKKMTIGVMHRVYELADRKNIEDIRDKFPPFHSIAPLTDILSEILNVGPNTKKVKSAFEEVIKITGSEFNALWWAEKDMIKKVNIPLFSEAIDKLRNGDISLTPGYDGEFGKIKIFEDDELQFLKSGKVSLFKNFDNNKNFKKKDIKKDKYGEIKKNKIEDIKKTETIFEFNEDQRKIIESKPSNTIVIAGPGTGKTATLTGKIKYLIDEKNVDPEKIKALTFTIKASREMKDRIDNDKVYTGTIHSFALKYISDENLKIINDDARIHLVKKAIKETCEKITPKKALNLISISKQNKKFMDMDEKEPFIRRYEELKKEFGLIDFDDILLIFLEKLKKEEAFKKGIQKDIKFLLIDEFQDLNDIQYEIIREISDENINVFAIGDPDQSIYGFRGSSSDIFQKFSKDFKDVKIFNLTKNYRSSMKIVEGSNQIIKEIPNELRKKIDSLSDKGETINIITVEDEKRGAYFIVDEIQKLIGGTGHHIIHRTNEDYTDLYSFSEIAVLCRTSREAKFISEILDEKSIPNTRVSENPLTEEKIVKKIISYLHMMDNEPDLMDLILNPFGIDSENKSLIKEKLESFRNNIDKKNKISDIINFIMENTDIDLKSESERLAVEYLKKISGCYEKIKDFINDLFINRVSDLDNRGEKVSVMTLHSSKGLEFPVVFIPGCVYSNIPFIKDDEKTDMEEERRIFYVGITRAEDKIYLLNPLKIKRYGKVTETSISPFIYDLEKNLKKEKIIRKKYIEKKAVYKQLGFFD